MIIPNYQKYTYIQQKISMQDKVHYSALVKNQYLPPSLESNYLSLFDIQVKMAKDYISGTEQDKIMTIKKRIKKFFDYGDTLDSIQVQQQTQKKTNFYPPFQVCSNQFKKNVIIDSSKIIVYGKDITLAKIEKTLHGFISVQKIDDSNIKFLFPNKIQSENVLINIVRNRSSSIIESIKHPKEIEWFQIQLKEEIQKQDQQLYVEPVYVRFVTNMDDILFKNDLYFRRLLGKVRQMVQQNQLKYQQQQQQINERIQRQKLQKQRKRKPIHKQFRAPSKAIQQSYDSLTIYSQKQPIFQLNQSRDYLYQPQKSSLAKKVPIQNRFLQQQKQINRKNNRRQNRFIQSHEMQQVDKSYTFNNLNISAIQSGQSQQIQLEQYRSVGRKHGRSVSQSSQAELDFRPRNDQTRGRQRIKQFPARQKAKELPLRNKLISEYRQRSITPNTNKLGYNDNPNYRQRANQAFNPRQGSHFQVD